LVAPLGRFFADGSIGDRGIHLIFVMPGLLLGFALDSMSGRLLPPLAAGRATAARKPL